MLLAFRLFVGLKIRLACIELWLGCARRRGGGTLSEDDEQNDERRGWQNMLEKHDVTDVDLPQ